MGANGKFSPVARWVRAAAYNEVAALSPAYYGYFRNLLLLAESSLELFYRPGQIGFIFPMQPGVDCLALSTRAGSRDPESPAG